MSQDYSININTNEYNIELGQDQDFTIEIEQAPDIAINLNEQGPMGPQGEPGEQGLTGNGIETIRQTGTSGLEDTYTIYYTNGDTQDYTVTNGEKGDDGFSPLVTIASTATGATITITDAEGTTTADITNGIDGEDGEAATIEVGTVTTGAAGTSATVVNSGTSSAAVFDFTIPRGDKGETGETGNGISSIAQTGTSGLVDTYTIYYTNGNDTTFDVTNGQDGTDGQDGYSPTATVTQSNNVTTITITDKNGTTTESIDLSGIVSDIEDIQELIPNQASVSNQLADKNFVNSSIATNTAYFIGTFNSVAELEAYSGTLTNNDYAFVVGTDSAGNTVYDRYKYNADTQEWIFEYELNNSSFTANQWAAINSGITNGDVSLISTALQPNDNISELVNNAGYLVSTDFKTINNNSLVGSGNISVQPVIDSNNKLDYAYLSNTPTIPTVNNATLTIQKNGTTVNTFTANASSNVTANITVPTDTSDLTNNAGYITGITSSDVTTALGYTPYNSSNPNGYISGVAWGDVTGTLSSQTDLQNALDAKQDVLTSANAGNCIEITQGTTTQTVSGEDSIVLENAVVNELDSVTLYGKCFQNGIPTVANPIPIMCNNGELKASPNLLNVNNITSAAVTVSVEVNKTYTWSFDQANYNFRWDSSGVTGIDSNGNTVSGGLTIIEGSYTGDLYTFTVVSSSVVAVKTTFRAQGISPTVENIKASKMMFEEGISRTTYMPYGQIYVNGTIETIGDSVGNTATAEMLLSVSTIKDTQEVISGDITRNCEAVYYDGTQIINTPYLSTTGGLNSGSIIVHPKSTPSSESVTGQILEVQNGRNTIEVLQSAVSGLGLSATYNKSGSIIIDFTNDAGYTTNVGTVTSVNNTSPDSSGNVSITIPAAQVNSDWNASSGVAQILNKPNLATVATSGSYNDLTNKPTIPSEVTETTVSGWGFTKNVGTVTSVNNITPVNGNVTITIPDTATWGNITGTLSNQTDLQSALDSKVEYAMVITDYTL